jgi:hypothetical protein
MMGRAATMGRAAIIALQSFAICAGSLPYPLFKAVQDYFVHGLGPSLIACTADTSDPHMPPTLRFAPDMTVPFTRNGC